MEATNLGDRDDPSGVRCLDRTWFRTVLLQRQMGPGPVIIIAERLQVAVQTGLVEHNQVIKAFATYGANHPFDIRALPWGTWRGKHLFDSHRFHLLDEVMPENAVAVPQQITWRALPRKCFPELLSRPFGSRMRRDSEMHNPPTLVGQYQKHIQDLEPDRRHGEEIDGYKALDMVLEESPPRLGRRLATADQVFAHARFADIDAELQQLAMDTPGSCAG